MSSLNIHHHSTLWQYYPNTLQFESKNSIQNAICCVVCFIRCQFQQHFMRSFLLWNFYSQFYGSVQCMFWQFYNECLFSKKLLVKCWWNYTTVVDFINIFHKHFLYEILVPKCLKAKTKLCNFWRQNFVQKTRALNDDEIDYCFP